MSLGFNKTSIVKLDSTSTTVVLGLASANTLWIGGPVGGSRLIQITISNNDTINNTLFFATQVAGGPVIPLAPVDILINEGNVTGVTSLQPRVVFLNLELSANERLFVAPVRGIGGGRNVYIKAQGADYL